ncbi:MAG: diacylglycerol kinase family protein [Saprospiraceae bacterium]|nr:diacylglycerol kinase family protein [Saprospiraceae bacterium]
MNYIKKRLLSFKWAFKGLFDLLMNHPNVKIHLLASIVAIGLSVYFNISSVEWCIIILSIVLVISLEAMNSALEYLTDLASPEQHPLAGKAKDIAATAVLVAAMGTVAVAAFIFIPKI